MKWLKSGEKYPLYFLNFAKLREKIGRNTPLNPTFSTQKMSPCCHPVCHPIVTLTPKSGTKHPSLQTTFKGIKRRSGPCDSTRFILHTSTHEKARRIGHLQPFHGQNTTSENPD